MLFVVGFEGAAHRLSLDCPLAEFKGAALFFTLGTLLLMSERRLSFPLVLEVSLFGGVGRATC